MRPLKCWIFKPWCWFNGHEPVPGTFYSVAYGKRIPCTCCKYCRVIL